MQNGPQHNNLFLAKKYNVTARKFLKVPPNESIVKLKSGSLAFKIIPWAKAEWGCNEARLRFTVLTVHKLGHPASFDSPEGMNERLNQEQVLNDFEGKAYPLVAEINESAWD